MIFNEKIHSFDKFIKNWKPENTYALYGASKDCVLLIESLDIILNNNKLKISCIIDDFIPNGTTFENIYKLNDSSYKPDNFLKANERKNLKVISFEQFQKDSKISKDKIIITSDVNYNKTKNFLIEKKYEENVDFCNYKKIAAIWPFKLENKTHLWRSDLLLTEKCTLSCTYCNMFMPHYKNPKHRDIDEIKNDFDLYFEKIDFVSVFHLVGGEPLMYPKIDEVLEYIGSKYRNKIGRLLLSTNGSLVPKQSTFDLFKKYYLLIYISNYTNAIKYGRRFNQFVDQLVQNNIVHLVRNNIEWSDFGDPNKIRFHNEKEIIDHFDKCTAPYKGLNQGKYYYCHLNTSAVLAGLQNLDEGDYIKIDNNLDKEELLKFDLGYLPKGYATFCKKCNGCNTGIEEIPVSYASQGIRG